MKTATILLVTGDPSLVDPVSQVIEAVDRSQVVIAADVAAAVDELTEAEIGLVLFHLPEGKGVDGRQLLSHIRTRCTPAPPFVAISEQYLPRQALELFRLGATDYLSRPIDLGRLRYLIDSLTLRTRHGEPVRRVAAANQAHRVSDPNSFLCSSAPLERVMEMVKRIAPQNSTVLLTGETGTGKTRLARLIHEMSPRCREPLLILNCGSLSPSLIESEMFGHVRGAFTGADRDRPGKFFEASCGTLVLDDVDALPIATQSKMLRVVDERVFEPVGSNETLPMQARLIAVSNRILQEEVRAGRFRNDLYFRLNVVEIELPPLRACPRRIGELVEHYVALFTSQNGGIVTGVSREALLALESYSWPGNVRELRNATERAVALATAAQLEVADFPPAIRNALSLQSPRVSSVDNGLAETRVKVEISCIANALRKHDNNRSRAAKELGISRVALYKKLRKYGWVGGP